MFLGINGFPQDDKTRVQQGGSQGNRQVGGLTRQERISAFLGVKRTASSTVSTSQKATIAPQTTTITKQTGEPSDAKIMTENFKNEVMGKLKHSKARKSVGDVKYYLNKLVDEVQTFNGAKKNKLTPNGTPEQNAIYNRRLEEKANLITDYAKFVGCGLELVQDSKTGLYKIKINKEVLDVPERKVAIVNEDTEDGVELVPQIVD